MGVIAWLILMMILVLLTVGGVALVIVAWRTLTADRVPFDFSRKTETRRPPGSNARHRE